MATQNLKLNQLIISSPCHADRSEMQDLGGGGQFCPSCNKAVHDFAAMTPLQIEARILASRGRLCARITRDPDGQVVTRTPPPPDFSSRRVSPIVVAVVTALLGLSGHAAASDPAPQPAAIRGTVAYERGAIPGVSVHLQSAQGEPIERDTLTSAIGEFAFEGLTPGTYKVTATLEGFADVVSSEIALRAGQSLEIELVTEPVIGEQVTGVVAGREPSLRLGVAESSLAVLATAGRSRVLKEEDGFETVSTELRLDGRSGLKGKIPGRGLEVIHERSMLEEKIVPGSRILALLQPQETEGGKPSRAFQPVVSYPLRTVSEAEATAYRDRLLALFSSQRGEATAVDPEWLVATAEEPLTRAEVSQDLLGAELSAEQRERLNRALAQTSGLTQGDLGLALGVMGWDRKAALDWLVQRVLTVAPATDGVGFEAMSLLAGELADPALQALVQEAAAADRKEQDRCFAAARPSREKMALYEKNYGAIQSDLLRRFRQALTDMARQSS